MAQPIPKPSAGSEEIVRKPAQVETLLTPEWIAHELHLHVSQIRRIFSNEPGVVNVALGKKNRTIRVPMSVYQRFLRSRTSA